MQSLSAPPSRRGFLRLSSAAAAGLIAAPGAVLHAQSQQTQARPRPPALAPSLVQEYVRAAHVDLEKTKSLLAETPTLLNAVWDWGGGDFEAAIGGAGHMGAQDIALYLLSQGARMDIFVAAMLGKLDILKTTLGAFPELLYSKGPHGIPLMAHARKGGEQAAAVVEYLRSLRLE